MPDTSTRNPNTLLPWVLVRHDTPDGLWHFDWMLDPGPDHPAQHTPDVRLITFRLREHPKDYHDSPVERLPEHRIHYLTYEGPLSGNRGQVRRIDEGTWSPHRLTPSLIEGDFRVGPALLHFFAKAINQLWTLTSHPLA
jgi:hypothetical protein